MADSRPLKNLERKTTPPGLLKSNTKQIVEGLAIKPSKSKATAIKCKPTQGK